MGLLISLIGSYCVKYKLFSIFYILQLTEFIFSSNFLLGLLGFLYKISHLQIEIVNVEYRIGKF